MKSIRIMALCSSILCGFGLPTAASAQTGDTGATAGTSDIIVTARRMEERLSDVPISISVLDQSKLDQNNVTNIGDLAAVTPGLQLNNRYGDQNVSFTIRGFTQEVRTYSTVGVYFADVVGPRGSGATLGGDGISSGAMFDLENVQVLKGPQGTLFGRNTSGGAVLIVPKKPTNDFEGYVEGTAGDDDLLRFQAVLNIPVSDSLQLRFGVDRMERDGYLKNVGTVGDGRWDGKGLGNTDYWSLRASALLQITPTIENYTVATYNKSKSNGTVFKMIDCYPGKVGAGIPMGDMACEQIAREEPYGPWAVTNRVPDAQSQSEQWQIINTTTFEISDNLTVKNILSYGEYRNIFSQDLLGLAGVRLGTDASLITSANDITGYAVTHVEPLSGYSNAESSLVEELQLQGTGAGGRLTWQMGGYMELNDPLQWSGQQSYAFTACDNVSEFDCAVEPGFSLGSVGFQRNKSKFRDYALYGQASYELMDRLTLTAGLRYTWDKHKAQITNQSISISTMMGRCRNGRALEFGTMYPIEERTEKCLQNLEQSTSAPTWTIGLEYRPIDDVMIYGKYSRGYRQGGLALFSPDPVQPFEDEKIDAYEAGLKSNWGGAMPGGFDIFGFYNDFTDQQLLLSISDSRGLTVPTIAIVNAGASRMYGFEAEFRLQPMDGLTLVASYAYVNTKLKEFTPPALPPDSPWDTIIPPEVGGPLSTVIPRQLSVSAAYRLPVSEDLGDITFGAQYNHNSSYQGANDTEIGSGNGRLPAADTLNLNFSWIDVAGSPIDLKAFITNVTNEVNYIFAAPQSNVGFNGRQVAPPRRFGVSVKYKFGR